MTVHLHLSTLSGQEHPAAAMEKFKSGRCCQDRFDRLLKEVQSISAEVCSVHEGTTQSVLVEAVNDHDPALVTGRLSNNILVHFPGEKELIGKIVSVRLDACKGFLLYWNPCIVGSFCDVIIFRFLSTIKRRICVTGERRLEKVSGIICFFGGLLWRYDYYEFEMIFMGFASLVHVCAGRNLPLFHCMARENGSLERSSLAPDGSLRDLCGSRRIFHRDHCK